MFSIRCARPSSPPPETANPVRRTYFHKVADIANEPGVPGRMASAIRVSPCRSTPCEADLLISPHTQSWPEDVAKYKGSDLYTPVILPYLDQLHEEQLAAGIVVMNEEEGEPVDASRYPF